MAGGRAGGWIATRGIWKLATDLCELEEVRKRGIRLRRGRLPSLSALPFVVKASAVASSLELGVWLLGVEGGAQAGMALCVRWC